MELSPDSQNLAVLYISGSLAIYNFPSLQRKFVWNVEEQVYSFKESPDNFHGWY